MKSLKKAIDVLNCFSLSEPELGVTQISERLGVQKSTVHNILATFEQDGFVEQDAKSRKYRLGLVLLNLSNVVREGLGLRKVALPVMERVRDRFGETVHLALEQDGMVVYIESVQPAERSVARIATGKRAYMHCTGVGKAILAYAPDEQVREIVARHGLPSFTEQTITDVSALQSELETSRRHGYSLDNMEHEWGIRCIAVPIRNENGRVEASMSISGPSESFPLEAVDRIAQPFALFGLEVSRQLGWLGY